MLDQYWNMPLNPDLIIKALVFVALIALFKVWRSILPNLRSLIILSLAQSED